MSTTVTPHGGILVRRVTDKGFHDTAILPRIALSRRELCDLELIAVGACSPLEGFMGKAELDSVLTRKRLKGGLPWTIPLTLSCRRDHELKAGKRAALVWEQRIVGAIDVEELYEFPKLEEARLVFGTTDDKHPGVRATLDRGEVLIAGKVALFDKVVGAQSMEPLETRAEIERRGWRKVAAFQTRNPIHRAHEYLIKTALEGCDGVLIHPLVGETKADDVPADVRLRAYEALIRKYFPSDRVLLATLPASMRYAGPREAIHHAILRKNYGATHFIVGRDHAGVGTYYGPFDAQKAFDEFPDLGIEPINFDNAFFCRSCKGFATAKTCPHSDEARLSLSGSEVRSRLARGENLPEEFTRPEVAEILREYYGLLAK